MCSSLKNLHETHIQKDPNNGATHQGAQITHFDRSGLGG